jgi:ABC-type dipeptide/oligopeptide/nickel transport system permease subunit
MLVGTLKQGQPGPESMWWWMSTPIGATPCTSVGISLIADAFDPTLTVEMPKSREKNPSALFVCLTVIMSFDV